MDWLIILDNYGALIFLAVVAAACLVIYQIRNNRPSLSGPAEVVSHRVEPAKFAAASAWAEHNNWNYYITFRLSDGEEIELYVSRQEYDSISDGQKGILTWSGENMGDFVTENT